MGKKATEAIAWLLWSASCAWNSYNGWIQSRWGEILECCFGYWEEASLAGKKGRITAILHGWWWIGWHLSLAEGVLQSWMDGIGILEWSHTAIMEARCYDSNNRGYNDIVTLVDHSWFNCILQLTCNVVPLIIFIKINEHATVIILFNFPWLTNIIFRAWYYQLIVARWGSPWLLPGLMMSSRSSWII